MSHKTHSTHGQHGLSCEEFDELLRRAAGRCEVCGIAQAEATLQRLCIDHDHRRGTGRDHLRGMVCVKCNCSLSYVDNGMRAPTDEQATYLQNAWFWTHHPDPQPPTLPAPLPLGVVGKKISDVKQQLSSVLSDVEENGTIIYLTSWNRPIAMIAPLDENDRVGNGTYDH